MSVSDTSNTPMRALLTWQVLLCAAHHRQTLTYSMAGDLIGVHRRSMRIYLDVIQKYCTAHDLLPLTCLVVSKSEGKPGGGYIDRGLDIDAAREQVYDHPWFQLPPPTLEKLGSVGPIGVPNT